MLDRLRSLFRAGHGIKVHLDEPAVEIAGNFAAFRGWIAAEAVIDGIRRGGRPRRPADGCASRPARRQGDAWRAARCRLRLFVTRGLDQAETASFRPARLIVNGKVVLARRFTCVQEGDPEPSELVDRSDCTLGPCFMAGHGGSATTARVARGRHRRRTSAERSTRTQRLFPGRDARELSDVRCEARR